MVFPYLRVEENTVNCCLTPNEFFPYRVSSFLIKIDISLTPVYRLETVGVTSLELKYLQTLFYP